MLAFGVQADEQGIALGNSAPRRESSEARQPHYSSNGKPPQPFLRVPPFPGSKVGELARWTNIQPPPDRIVDDLLVDVRSAKVGGTYWGPQPCLPIEPYVLIRARDGRQLDSLVGGLGSRRPLVVWTDSTGAASALNSAHVHTVHGPCDPWHLVSNAEFAIVDADDELALIASIAGVPVQCLGEGRFAALSGTVAQSALRDVFWDVAVAPFQFFDPYSGDPIPFRGAVAHCEFWRRLIDGNRDFGAAVGFAFWKRSTVTPLLWPGSGRTQFKSSKQRTWNGAPIPVWRSRASPRILSELERQGACLVEVEDGFVRSAGLGADCVPPLSILVDRKGAHFDASRPSELEDLLQNGVFSPAVLERARELRRLIVNSGVSKYDSGRGLLERRLSNKRHVLVPGQVEDDRAVISGGGPTSNLELLRRVRRAVPDAYIMYKPHPDVEAGHRAGNIPDDMALSVADEIVRDAPIAALLDLVDEVHVNTSLAGFEALMRDKPVTTHGVPFYAGWGLTRDLGPVPSRRTATRTIDELVAAALLLYPRYLDPVTGLPCPAEVLVRRLADGQSSRRDGLIVRLRKFQGRCRRGLARLRSRG